MARVPTHPGEVLREEFLEPLGLSSHQLAEAIGVPANRISEIAREARDVTADTALRLAKHFNTTPEFWMNLQTAHDLSKAAAARDVPRYFAVKDDATPRSIRSEKTGQRVTRFAASGKFMDHKVEDKSFKGVRKLAASSLTQRADNKGRRIMGSSNKPTAKGHRPKHKK